MQTLILGLLAQMQLFDSSFEYLNNRIQISQKDTHLSTQEQSGAKKHIGMQIGHINLTSRIKIDSSASVEHESEQFNSIQTRINEH